MVRYLKYNFQCKYYKSYKNDAFTVVYHGFTTIFHFQRSILGRSCADLRAIHQRLASHHLIIRDNQVQLILWILH